MAINVAASGRLRPGPAIASPQSTALSLAAPGASAVFEMSAVIRIATRLGTTIADPRWKERMGPRGDQRPTPNDSWNQVSGLALTRRLPKSRCVRNELDRQVPHVTGCSPVLAPTVRRRLSAAGSARGSSPWPPPLRHPRWCRYARRPRGETRRCCRVTVILMGKSASARVAHRCLLVSHSPNRISAGTPALRLPTRPTPSGPIPCSDEEFPTKRWIRFSGSGLSGYLQRDSRRSKEEWRV
jgi:hypothetical protein